MTVTENTHEADAAVASVAVHCTRVAPPVNGVPDDRVQLTCTGATPPVVVGDVKVTLVGLTAALTVTFGGHEIESAGTVGDGGVEGGDGDVGGAAGEEHAIDTTTARAPLAADSHRKRRVRWAQTRLAIKLFILAQRAENS